MTMTIIRENAMIMTPVFLICLLNTLIKNFRILNHQPDYLAWLVKRKLIRQDSFARRELTCVAL